MITYKTTDKTDHYMEYLRFSLRLKLLSYLHSFVLSIKRKLEEKVDGLTFQDAYA